jgi:hypothetical protein
MRTDADCRMHFASENHVMVNIANERILTFDKEGYVIAKKFDIYEKPLKILRESPMIEGVKFLVV